MPPLAITTPTADAARDLRKPGRDPSLAEGVEQRWVRVPLGRDHGKASALRVAPALPRERRSTSSSQCLTRELCHARRTATPGYSRPSSSICAVEVGNERPAQDQDTASPRTGPVSSVEDLVPVSVADERGCATNEHGTFRAPRLRPALRAMTSKSSSVSASGNDHGRTPHAAARAEGLGDLRRHPSAPQPTERDGDGIIGRGKPTAAALLTAHRREIRAGSTPNRASRAYSVRSSGTRSPSRSSKCTPADRHATRRRQRRNQQQRHVSRPGAIADRSASYSSHRCARSVLSPRSTNRQRREPVACRGGRGARPAAGLRSVVVRVSWSARARPGHRLRRPPQASASAPVEHHRDVGHRLAYRSGRRQERR